MLRMDLDLNIKKFSLFHVKKENNYEEYLRR